jgi:rubrerythrin
MSTATETNGGLSRAALLTRGAAAAGVLGGGALVASRAGGANGNRDVEVLNFALQLESLQAAFYADAKQRGGFGGELGTLVDTVLSHERAHVRFLRKVLGNAAKPQPNFDFGDVTQDRARFLDAAIELEEIAVGAYNGQAANLSREALGAAVTIVSVEGRHVAWVRDLAGRDPSPWAADPLMDASRALERVKATGFVVA